MFIFGATLLCSGAPRSSFRGPDSAFRRGIHRKREVEQTLRRLGKAIAELGGRDPEELRRQYYKDHNIRPDSGKPVDIKISIFDQFTKQTGSYLSVA